jgi:DNA-directed RNA polymerase subunit beta
MQRLLKSRLSSVDVETVMPADLINVKPFSSAIREFFATSQLSQFAEQTNPLAELTHQRRLTSLGIGGLSRDRATSEARDVHPTNYGKICPIETPEGQNIGLVTSLASYARINKYGFIETPYVKVEQGIPTGEVVYMNATEDVEAIIAPAGALVQDVLNHPWKDEGALIDCRYHGEYIKVPVDKITHTDVSSRQILSVAASLIPFVECDEAGRALMGSNMQRQGVPLIRPEAPLVGTGVEKVVAAASGITIKARKSGRVLQADNQKIIIHTVPQNRSLTLLDLETSEQASHVFDENTPSSFDYEVYPLKKFSRTNSSTCINQRPLVRPGDYIFEGDLLTEDFSCTNTEIALGSNVLVAFMTWKGYCFEDAIILSERISQDDVFTSIHLEEFELVAQDTKLGPEEITRDIPGLNEEALRHLDITGVPKIGAEVKTGDILIGQVSPKGESPLTPEEKLLRVIFLDKISDMKDSSLKVPSGVSGTVIDVKIYSRRGVEKDERTLLLERADIAIALRDQEQEEKILQSVFAQEAIALLSGKKSAQDMKGLKGAVFRTAWLKELSMEQWESVKPENKYLHTHLIHLLTNYNKALFEMKARTKTIIARAEKEADLPAGVLKVAKVIIAISRKIQPGDKMAGRHGNKGVVSKIVPIEDMPHLPDGTPIDVILNPLGVASRMNIGQIMETHLGWASRGFSKHIKEALDAFVRSREAAMAEIVHEKKSKTESEEKVWEREAEAFWKFSTLKDPDYRKLIQVITDIYNISDVKEFEKKYLPHHILDLAIRSITSGIPMKTPVFDGASIKDIDQVLQQAWGDTTGQVYLRDGQTGELFDNPVTVGMKYMMKLHHLVDDKIHARSVGPYSLVTQQPVGGKGQFGAQRLGEMEVWALEAYAASNLLLEMLTVKSDDSEGRLRVYSAIARGEGGFETGMPASFNVLMKELRALGLDIEPLTEDELPKSSSHDMHSFESERFEEGLDCDVSYGIGGY